MNFGQTRGLNRLIRVDVDDAVGIQRFDEAADIGLEADEFIRKREVRPRECDGEESAAKHVDVDAIFADDPTAVLQLLIELDRKSVV